MDSTTESQTVRPEELEAQLRELEVKVRELEERLRLEATRPASA
jgi:hypothetical protein